MHLAGFFIPTVMEIKINKSSSIIREILDHEFKMKAKYKELENLIDDHFHCQDGESLSLGRGPCPISVYVYEPDDGKPRYYGLITNVIKKIKEKGYFTILDLTDEMDTDDLPF